MLKAHEYEYWVVFCILPLCLSSSDDVVVFINLKTFLKTYRAPRCKVRYSILCHTILFLITMFSLRNKCRTVGRDDTSCLLKISTDFIVEHQHIFLFLYYWELYFIMLYTKSSFRRQRFSLYPENLTHIVDICDYDVGVASIHSFIHR